MLRRGDAADGEAPRDGGRGLVDLAVGHGELDLCEDGDEDDGAGEEFEFYVGWELCGGGE